MSNGNKNELIIISLLASIIGLIGGISGFFFSQSFLAEKYFGPVDVNNINLSTPNFIIRDAKNVVIEQNVKIQEVKKNAKLKFVGIYENKSLNKTNKISNKDFSIDDFYIMGEQIAEGIVITSDGWIVSDFSPTNNTIFDSASSSLYYVVTHDNKFYPINKIVNDKTFGVKLLHVDAKDLPVVELNEFDSNGAGQTIVGLNWENEIWITTLLEDDSTKVFSSDNTQSMFKLREEPPVGRLLNYYFTIDGKLSLIYDKNRNNFFDAYHLLYFIKNASLGKEPIRPTFGISYLDSSELLSKRSEEREGILVFNVNKLLAVEKGSPAFLSGIKYGDLILTIDDRKVFAKNLNHILQQYEPGDLVEVKLIRGEKELVKKVKLGPLTKK